MRLNLSDKAAIRDLLLGLIVGLLFGEILFALHVMPKF